MSSKFTVKFGSGHFLISTPNTDLLAINKIDKSASIDDEVIYEIVQNKVDSSQRNIIIHIIDACFNSVEGEFENSKSIEIELVKPYKLQLLSLNRIQLGSQVGCQSGPF